MAEPLRQPAGWDDILKAPEDAKAEVIGGELGLLPRPSTAHQRSLTLLMTRLGRPYDVATQEGPGGWWLLPSMDCAFGPFDIVSPDLGGWQQGNLPDLPEDSPIRIRPDWICEIQSPSTARRDRITKADLYLRAGVPHYWLVDPEARTLEALEASEGRWVRLGAWSDGDLAAIPPFEAVPMDVGSLFPPERPRPEPSEAEPKP